MPVVYSPASWQPAAPNTYAPAMPPLMPRQSVSAPVIQPRPVSRPPAPPALQSPPAAGQVFQSMFERPRVSQESVQARPAPTEGEQKEQQSRKQGLRNLGLLFGSTSLMGIAGLLLSRFGSKAGVVGLGLTAMASFGVLGLTPGMYEQAAKGDKTPRILRFLRGAGLTLLFGYAGVRSGLRTFQKMFGKMDTAPLLVERILNVVKDNATLLLLTAGFSDITRALTPGSRSK